MLKEKEIHQGVKEYMEFILMELEVQHGTVATGLIGADFVKLFSG